MIGRCRPGALCKTVAGTARWCFVVRREEKLEIVQGNDAAQPAECRDEHELQLRDDRPGDTEEEIMEAPVVEVVLDPRAADPADAAVDDDELAVVDASEPVEVPPSGAAGRERLGGSAQLRRSHHPDVDAGGEESLVERAATAVRIRALTIHDNSDRNPVRGFRAQHLRELVTDRTGSESELVDVDRRRRRRDVVQHRRIEVPALDVNVRGRGDAFFEDEPQITQSHRRTKQLAGAVTVRSLHDVRLTRGASAGGRPHGSAE